MNKLILGNLIHRPVRTIVTMLAVAIEVVMILSIVGIMIGMVANSQNETSGIGADTVVRPANSSFISAIGGAPVPAAVAGVLARLPHVAVAAPVITNLSTVGSVETIWGIDYATYNGLKPFVYVSGGPFQGPNDVIIDDLAARSTPGYRVGDTIQIMSHPFRVSGIVERGRGSRKFIPIQTLGALLGTPRNASLFYLRADDPSNEALIEQEVRHTPGLTGYKTQSMADMLAMITPSHLPAFTPALDSVITIAVIIGFLVIFQSMYTAVIERTREIGILKSLGASRGYILASVLREAAMVTVVGIVLGIVITLGIKAFLNYHFPTLSFNVPFAWWLRSLGIAFIGATLGATYPALKAAGKDPIDALAYE
ncbi:ABC transporter permease [Acidipila sp. EB88]|uniref:ABC transporter permease n=1 Tax=Acidipila sp. EB88 TaxID=2305226 RepID=UPI000F5F5E8B|nr:FtsX-like permease family protein [Acidipila sp. EB88]RRA48486.1 ABC transporter permease [Acidipila sp. EB88]